LHPGYPECARPDDRDHFRRDGRRGGMEEARSATDVRYSGGRPHESARPIHVIRVGERARKSAHHDGLAKRLSSYWTRWRSVRRGLDR
jgi:hypothetical protein